MIIDILLLVIAVREVRLLSHEQGGAEKQATVSHKGAKEG